MFARINFVNVTVTVSGKMVFEWDFYFFSLVIVSVRMVVGMKLVMSYVKFPQAPFARAPFGECRYESRWLAFQPEFGAYRFSECSILCVFGCALLSALC